MPIPPTPANNLLFILVDDLNTALGCYGHPAVFTPNLDRLAARGLLFQRAYCPYPLCGPSRTAMLTGQRPESVPMPDNEVAWRDLRPNVMTLPELFRRHGFYTAGFGKIFHHGIRAADLDAWRKANPGKSLPHTYDDAASWNESSCPLPAEFDRLAEGLEQRIDGAPHGGVSLHTIRVRNQAVLSDVNSANRAVAFLESRSVSTQPFLLAVGFQKPHLPLIAPERWWAHYDRLSGPDLDAMMGPTAATPARLPEGTLKNRRFHRGMAAEQRHHVYRGYLACVSHMDEQLGRVLDALEARGLADRTVVAFVADHGYHLGEQGQWDKMMLLEPSLRVPMVLAGPGIPSGRVCERLVESMDLFPTLCAHFGITAHQPTTATDLSPWITDPALASDRSAFAWLCAGGREGWTIRTKQYRYGEVSLQGASPQAYLFDYDTDPHETNNVASDPDYAGVVRTLSERMKAHFETSAPGHLRLRVPQPAR